MTAKAGPRIAPLPPPYSPEVAEDLRKLMPPGMEPIRLFTTLAHNPRVLGRVRRGGLLDPGAVSLRDREIVILRTTALCGAEYEWGVHVTFFAGAAQFTPEQIAATVSGSTEPFTPAEATLLEMCEALHRFARIDGELWARLSAGRPPAELIELIALAGQYHMVSYLASSIGLELEPDAARFPSR